MKTDSCLFARLRKYIDIDVAHEICLSLAVPSVPGSKNYLMGVYVKLCDTTLICHSS